MSTLRMYAGDTGHFRFTCTEEDGTAFDLTGASATWTLKRYQTDEDALVEKTTDDGLTVSATPEDGLLDLELEPDDTVDLEPGYYRWDLEVELIDYVYTMDSGTLALDGDMTRPVGS